MRSGYLVDKNGSSQALLSLRKFCARRHRVLANKVLAQHLVVRSITDHKIKKMLVLFFLSDIFTPAMFEIVAQG
ncbi:MAG TPA: hypothetical protein DEB70_11660 [Planctomycetaceae bacterium]|nr:hypothetical protein [Planctomycetaceae bacterium]